jgi:exo-1,4-beta-D-glucosaminidase
MDRLELNQGWRIQHSALDARGGEAISVPGAATDGWHETTAPRTVLCSLIRDGTYPDVRIWPNAFRVPDSSDRFNEEQDLARYSHLPGGRNPWRDPWWYRTEFALEAITPGQRVWLNLLSLNYRAEVWVNGSRLADREQIAGMFQRFRLDVTDSVREGRNALALLICPVDHAGDPETQLEVYGKVRGFHTDLCNDVTEVMSVGYDCFPTVPDRNLGLVQEVSLDLTGPVDLRHPFVRSRLDLPALDPARLTVSVELINASAAALRGVLEGAISDPAGRQVAAFTRPVTLLGRETREITVTSTDAPELALADPQLWWPNTYGGQPLYTLRLTFTPKEAPPSRVSARFGVRRVDRELHEVDGAHGFRLLVNGQRIFQRGGYVQPEMMFDWDRDRVAAELRYLAHANLNYVVFEDIPNPPDWYLDLCDELGLLFWNCYYDCYWLQYNRPWDIDVALLEDCTVDIAKRYRNHPSLIVNMAQNEGETREDVYEMWRRTVLQHDPERILIPSGSFPWYRAGTPPWFDRELPVGCNDYMPKTYGWQLPAAYYQLVRDFRNWMFMIESGAASVPPLESLLEFMPHLAELGPNPEDNPTWPLDAAWAHYGANSYYEWFDRGLRLLYGEPTDLADYVRKAHLTTYDQHRGFFEAVHHRMWDLTSGFGEWKINSAFPDIQWQLYDWFLRPMVSLYAIRKACASFAIQLSPLDRTVTVVNSTLAPARGLQARAVAYDDRLAVLVEQTQRIDLAANSAGEVLALQLPASVTDLPVYYVKLELRDAAGGLLADNLYWLSAALEDVEVLLDPAQAHAWPANKPIMLPRHTPCLGALAGLPMVRPGLRARPTERGLAVEVDNGSEHLAFFIRARVLRDGREALPALWSDNYFSLLPGESKALTVEFPPAEGACSVALDGWNIVPVSVEVNAR